MEAILSVITLFYRPVASTYHFHLFGESIFRSSWYVVALRARLLALEKVLTPGRVNVGKRLEHVRPDG